MTNPFPTITSAEFEAYERAVEIECLTVAPQPTQPEGGAPFTAGDQIVDKLFPENGSLTVDVCEFVAGHWRVQVHATVGTTAIALNAPAEHFQRLAE